MSVKPEDIPQEIWDAADAIAGSSIELHTRAEIDDLATKIARAIMAAVEEEREACANMAYEKAKEYYNVDEEDRDFCAPIAVRLAGLGAAIRSRQSKDG